MSWTISTFNVHYGGLAPHGTGWYDLASVTAGLDADVRVFQEDWRHELEPSRIHTPPGHTRYELTTDTALLRPAWPCLDGAQRTRPGALGITVTTRFEVISTHRVPLPRIRTNTKFEALCLRLATPSGPVDLYAVHTATTLLPAGSALQVRALASYVNHPSRAGSRAVIAGDHNLWRSVASRMYGPTWACATDQPTWPAHRPHSHIDHIWVRGMRVSGRTGPDVGSDHLPVTAVIDPTISDTLRYLR